MGSPAASRPATRKPCRRRPRYQTRVAINCPAEADRAQAPEFVCVAT